MDPNAALLNLCTLATNLFVGVGCSQEAQNFGREFLALDANMRAGAPAARNFKALRTMAGSLEVGPEQRADVMDLVYGFMDLDEHLRMGRMVPDAWKEIE